MRFYEEYAATDLEPPQNEIVEVIAVEEDDDLPIVELSDEDALILAAELGLEEFLIIEPDFQIELEPLPTQNDVQSDAVCEVDQEERERQDKVKAEEQEMFRLSRAELQKRLAEIDEELELLRIRKEKRRKEQAEYLELIEQHEQERKERQEQERLKRQEEIEKKKLEREQSKRAMKNPLGFQQQIIEERLPPPKFHHKTHEELAREKERVLCERVPPLDLDSLSEEEVRDRATDLYARLRNVFGTIFDLTEKRKQNEYDLLELRAQSGNTRDYDVATTVEGFQNAVAELTHI